MRKALCLLGLLFLVSVSAAAQDSSKIDMFAGYSFLHTGPGIATSSFNANGGVGSIALNVTSWASIVAEVGGIHVSSINGTDVDGTAMTYMLGPKISPFRLGKFSPFVQVLAGVTHTTPGFNQTTFNAYTLAISPGAGLDWNATRHLAIRLGQIDYLLTRIPTSTNQVTWNNFRYSTGIVLRF